MVLQLVLSCGLNESQSGPTLIHSTGVQHYKIPPEIIRILQENITNDYLSDHEKGVLCKVGPQRVLEVLRRNGFTLQKQTTGRDEALWTLVQGGSSDGGNVAPVAPTPNDDAEHRDDEEKKDDEEAEGAGEEEEAEKEEEEEGAEEEEEEEEE